MDGFDGLTGMFPALLFIVENHCVGQSDGSVGRIVG
jgi:hypothetical protein